jgi:hypothetical protein
MADHRRFDQMPEYPKGTFINSQSLKSAGEREAVWADTA